MLDLDPRVRVVACFVFAILVALSEEFLTLGLSISVSFLLVLASRILDRKTYHRFIEFNLLLLLLFFLLPFSFPGTPVFSLKGLTWSYEGMFRALKIILKANSIMLTFTALLVTLAPINLGVALNRLGLPNKLTSIFFLTIRYLDVIQREYEQLLHAMKLRCFRPGFNRHTFTTYGYLVGMLLIKSLDRAERILEAMKCRGFRNHFYTLTTFSLTKSDLTFGLLWSAIMIVLMYLEWGTG